MATNDSIRHEILPIPDRKPICLTTYDAVGEPVSPDYSPRDNAFNESTPPRMPTTWSAPRSGSTSRWQGNN
jgi:hypothetical protein